MNHSLDLLKKQRLGNLVLLLLLLMGLLLRLLPLLPPPTRILRHIPDDAYYLYRIAENLADKGMPSFDGVMPTTTARPLYIWMLAGLGQLTGHEALPQFAYLFGALADVLTAILLARLLRRWGVSIAGVLVGCGAYLFSSRTVLFVVNGMETPWAILAVVLYLNLLSAEGKNASKPLLVLGRGLILGAMMMLRLDFIFIALPLWLGEVLTGIKKKEFCWLISGALAGIVILPWIIWSFEQFGGLMPPSGNALAMVLGDKPSPGWAGIIIRLESIYDSFSALLPLILPKYQVWLGLGLGISFLLVLINYGKSEIFKRVVRFLLPLGIGIIALAIYLGPIRLFWREWNLVIGDVIFALVLGSIAGELLAHCRNKIILCGLLIWFAGANLNYMVDYWDGISPGQECMYRAAQWIKQNTSAETVVAAANGGILSWYSWRMVVDTAGIEDIRANAALRSHQLYAYLRERSVQYLVDPPKWPFDFYRSYWGIDIEDKLDTVYDPLQVGEERTLFDPVVYRLK